MNGGEIPNEQIADLLELANWAPTHGYTEPWRFVIYENPQEFCAQHAELYQQNTPAENFEAFNYNKLLHQGDKASHIVIAAMKRGSLPKIPAIEEIAAASAAIQNILLGATALNIASFWSMCGMALRPAFKDFFQFGDDDNILGVLYLGYVDQYPNGQRMSPIEQKITWVK